MKPRDTLDVLFRVLGRRGSARAPGTCRPGKGPEPHSFREKVFKKKHRACAACKEPVEAQGLICKVCKIASHRKCEAKVTSSCQPAPPPELRRNTAPTRRIEHLGSTKSLNTGKQRSTLPRSFSLDQVMERAYDLDLTYITERIISVFFPPRLEEQRYRGHLCEVAQMLKSKHEDKYTLFNLSEKRHDIARLNPKVQEFGWPDGHAPPLDRICSICKAMENWLHAHPQHVAVLHCKGNKGKTGVIVAAYMHYSKISASTLAMRKFCEDKVSAALQPSQRRYINYFSGLLSGAIKMNSHTLFLHHVRVPALPTFEAHGGYQPFLKIYQSMQLVYTSGIYSLTGPGTQKLCITLEPALLLKGDVMVKCYHRQSHGAERDVVFRVQFHTCTVHGSQLWFSKDELDEAWTDERFPFEASVEFIFSSGPEKIKGWEAVGNGPGVSVDYNISEPAVRWDSYESFNVHHEDSLEDLSHTQGPLDGSLYARVQKKRSLPGPVGSASPESPPPARGLLSVSSDSGHSSMLTERADEATPPARALPTPAEREELDRLLDGFGVPSPRAEPDCLPGNGARTRETAILDDEATPGPYPMRRRGLARHCSCHAGYLGTASPERPPTSISYRPEGTLERRRPAYSANGLPLRPDGFELPQVGEGVPYAEADKRRLYRSLSEGPMPPYPYERPPGPGRATAYRELLLAEEPPDVAPLCPCQDCQGKGAPPGARYGLRLEREPEGWVPRPPLALPLLLPYTRGHPEAFELEPPHAKGPGGHFTRAYEPPEHCRYPRYAPAYPPMLPPGSCPCCSPRVAPRLCYSPECHMHPQPGSASPDSTHGYEPPGMEPGDGYLRPGPVHPELPPPGEGAPWRDVPDGPGSLRRPPREPCSPCLAPPSLPEPPAPLHTSSPVQSQDSTTYGAPESPAPPSPADMAPSSATRTLERPPASSAGASGLMPTLSPPHSFTPRAQPNGPCPRTRYPPSPPAASPEPSPPRLAAEGTSGSPPPTSPAPRSPFASYRAVATLRATPAHNGPPQAEPRPGTLPRCAGGSPLSTQPPASPDAQGSPTPAFPLATAYYTGRESSPQPQPQPPLPEKRHAVPAGLWERSPLPSRSPGAPAHVSFAPDATTPDPQAEGPGHIQFVQDTSKFWYKPSLSRDQAIALLKDKEPGAFLIRDSNSFQGAYGLALKVATPPPNCAPHSSKGDPMEQLVRHFLIETGPKGVKIKGCQDEPHFGSLPALVSQHAITPISLPCRLRIPSKDPTEESPEVAVPANMSTAADLLRQGAACSVLYLSSVETESLTGPQAVAKAASSTLACNPRPPAAPVHFKVSAQGITLTDSQRKLFFRRHYPVSSVTYCSTDPQDRRWTNPDGTTSKLFGFVAKKQGSPCENVCHVFAELDPEQPAAAIVNFITKVLLGLHRK
ncbi:tensin-2 isoform B [Alligator mississippiensis]|uniref:Tensin-2 isoform B n=1 Tax=Alligator mississippiensis TaxID=8496 RepID=A0A151LYI3_ALLMI|nr:tensin-2 isoform B [Alligator mississippiensis]